MTYCLDSWAVLGWLEGDEPAATRVDQVLSSRPVMSWLNVGEVYYIVMRSGGEDLATEVLTSLRATVRLDEVSSDRVLSAARIKAAHPMAFADAIAVATSEAHEATLLTGDREILEADGSWAVEDLRS